VRKVVQLKVLCSVLLAIFLCGKLAGLTGPMHQDGPVTMVLVLPDSGVLPNSTTWIGWWIEREDGWHTYWEHPGNVGLTPKLDWELPDGFKVENLQFPFPKRVQMAGVKVYGHHGQTLYLARLQVPEIAVGERVKLTAKARWMVCSNVCLPQYTELCITLPVVDSLQPDKQWEPTFSEFLDNLPNEIPKKWTIKAQEIGQFTKLSITNIDPSKVKNAYLFGGDYLVCSDAQQNLRFLPSGFELLLPKPTWPKENPTQLHGLLQITSSSNTESFYTLQSPLK
jgi:DsbC/DsbD-like thiol-disulfide interchange protein